MSNKNNRQPLSPLADFCFIAMMQVAIKMKKEGETRAFFLEFAAEIWDSLEMNDTDELQNVLSDRMMSDLKRFTDGQQE